MQITLNQDEIEHAITQYVRTQITIADGQEIAIDLKAGRGDNGFTATLEIRPAGAVAAPAPAAPVQRQTADKPNFTKAKPAAVAEPQPEPEAEEAPEAIAEEAHDVKAEPAKPVNIFGKKVAEAEAETSQEEAPAKAPISAGSIFSKAAAAQANAG